MENVNNIEVGNRLTELRKNKGLTQEQVAKEISMNRTSLTRYENGERVPKANELISLSKLYNTTIDYILTGVSAENKSINEQTGLSDTTIERLKKFNNIPKNNSIDNKNFLPSLNLIINSKYAIFLLSEIYRYITNQYEDEQPEVIELLTGLRKAEYATQEELVKNWESWQISLITSTLNGMKVEHNKTK